MQALFWQVRQHVIEIAWWKDSRVFNTFAKAKVCGHHLLWSLHFLDSVQVIRLPPTIQRCAGSGMKLISKQKLKPIYVSPTHILYYVQQSWDQCSSTSHHRNLSSHWVCFTKKGLLTNSSSSASLFGNCLASPSCCSAEALRSSCLCHFCTCSVTALASALTSHLLCSVSRCGELLWSGCRNYKKIKNKSMLNI